MANCERPIVGLRDRASDYGNAIEVVGTFVMSGRLNHVFPPSQKPTQIGGLGECGAIGSGANDINKMLRAIDSKISPDMVGVVRSRRAGWLLQQLRLAEELFTGQYESSWGGYLEEIYFDPQIKRWVRQSRTMHLFYTAAFDGTTVSRPQLTRIIAYDPGQETGAILSAFDAGSGLDIYLYPIRNPMFPAGQSVGHAHDLWLNWKPDVVNVITGIGHEGAGVTYMDGIPVNDGSIGISLDGMRFQCNLDSPTIDARLNRQVTKFLDEQARVTRWPSWPSRDAVDRS